MGNWIVFAVIAVPVAIGVLWMLFDSSIVRIQPGELGLVLLRGQPTDRSLRPGIHWVPALRRRMVEIYPSLEMSYRAGSPDSDGAMAIDRSGPAVAAVLGDSASTQISYTLRFRLDPGHLTVVHDRFGRDGIWAAARDLSARSVRTALSDSAVTVDQLHGPQLQALEERVAARLTEDLLPHGLQVSTFAIDDVDLGRAGEAIQATVRARLELERERAENEMRVERARSDAQVAAVLADVPSDAALRYREADMWRDVGADVARSFAVPMQRVRAAVERVETATNDSDDTAGTDDEVSA